MGSTESAVLHRPEPDLTGPERLARRAELEAELRGLGAQITATQARFVAVLADYDALEGWGEWGARSALDWLSNHCGHAGPLGRAELALAHALPHLPLIRGAMEAGALSLDKAKAIASVAVPDTEEELLSLASHATANQIQKAMAAARRALNSKHAERMRRERYLDTSWDAYGYLQVRGQLSPAEGALFRKALAAAKESLYREQRSEGSTDGVPPEGHDDPRPDPTADAHDPPAAARADALVAMAESFMDHGPVAQGDSGENYQVIIHAPASVLDGGEGPCHLEQGPALAAETVRRILCAGADMVWLLEADEAKPVAVSKEKTQDLPRWLRRAVRCRDGGCVFPTGAGGRCGMAPEHCHVHHVIHRQHGGPDDTANCWTLCSFHHHLVHEGGFHMNLLADGNLEFRRPDGTLIATEVPAVCDRLPGVVPAEELHPDGSWALSNGEKMDLGLAVDGILGLIEPPSPLEDQPGGADRGSSDGQPSWPDPWPNPWPNPWPDPWGERAGGEEQPGRGRQSAWGETSSWDITGGWGDPAG